MKISIVTISYKNGTLLRDTVDSVYRQVLPPDVELEHIVVSSDNPDDATAAAQLRYASGRGSIVIHTPPAGCYNALNTGNRVATGDVIGIVHGGDLLAAPDVLAHVAEVFASAHPDFVYGDVGYIKAGSADSIIRRYSGRSFTPALLSKGIAPPHPSLFMTRRTLRAVGPYKEDYIIAADFDLFVRLFALNLRYEYIPATIVNMLGGGMSAKLYNRVIVNTAEKYRALRENNAHPRITYILSRYFYHLKYIRRND